MSWGCTHQLGWTSQRCWAVPCLNQDRWEPPWSSSLWYSKHEGSPKRAGWGWEAVLLWRGRGASCRAGSSIPAGQPGEERESRAGRCWALCATAECLDGWQQGLTGLLMFLSESGLSGFQKSILVLSLNYRQAPALKNLRVCWWECLLGGDGARLL